MADGELVLMESVWLIKLNEGSVLIEVITRVPFRNAQYTTGVFTTVVYR